MRLPLLNVGYQIGQRLRGLGVNESNQDWALPGGGRFILRLSLQGNSNPSWLNYFLTRLNGLDEISGQASASITGPILTVAGTASGSAQTPRNLRNVLLGLIDDYVTFDGSSVYLEADLVNPIQQNTGRNVSTREPIQDRAPEPQAPPRILDPEPQTEPDPVTDPVTGEPVDTGNGNGQPVILPAPVDGDGRIFGIEPKYLLIGAVAAFFLLGRK